MYSILVLDLSECYFADVYSDSEIKCIFNKQSMIPNKHKKGGQSAKRFAQNRQNAIVQCFKKINLMLKECKQEKIHLGISPIYQKRFMKYLSTNNINRIIHFQPIEYTNISGIYQYVSSLEKDKH